jgi:ABC-type branched-subunit amino acid transport system substrate-binding protein
MAWMRWRIAHVRALSGVLACAIGASQSVSSQPGELTPQGTILPSTHSQAEAGRAVKAALTAYFDEINQAGGIYNRRLESRFAASSDSPEELIATVRAFLADEPIFALIGSSAGGPEHDLARLVQEHEIPLISALALHPPASFPLNRYAFYLFSGLKEQARALAMFARKRYAQKNPRAGILFSDDAASRDIVQAIRAECSNAGWQAVEEMAIPRAQVDAARLAHRLSENATEIVFCLGSSGTEHRLLQEAQKLNWTPLVFIPGSLASRDIFDLPVSSDGRLFLAFPTLPSDQTPAGLAEYRRLAQTYKLPSQHVLAQLTALASASVLVEGLKRAGQALSREKLIETWEGFYKFKTGLTPALSYGPNRRTGARGAYIVSIDLVAKTLAPAGGWVEPN